ncbi:hypothetical protein L6452_12457 [Arctium lappa]|uniref:Uncharacterized protein n=1 Tax=Arctium lappa TaxID=4217 RepID=A0ACB9DRS0_ARCLA|nr:hypothetical protein L6452_12457 [Arctium lappa]
MTRLSPLGVPRSTSSRVIDISFPSQKKLFVSLDSEKPLPTESEDAQFPAIPCLMDRFPTSNDKKSLKRWFFIDKRVG